MASVSRGIPVPLPLQRFPLPAAGPASTAACSFQARRLWEAAAASSYMALGLAGCAAAAAWRRKCGCLVSSARYPFGRGARGERVLLRRASTATVAAPQHDVVEGLGEPAGLWRRFAELSRIPRASHHEAAVLEWIKGLAEERSLAWRQDVAGNLMVYRPGSGGGEDAPPVCLQGHVDMVTEKAVGSDHDFLKDPIVLARDGGWLTATGTTLGSDNGLGVCAALALLDAPATAKLPPLECLFTVAEEVGLVGAFNLDAKLITARTMLNLDTEEWPKVYFGCAGGGNSHITLPVQYEAFGDTQPTTSMKLMTVSISGLMGGHSGLNIGEDRGNALLCCARIARAALEAAGTEARLCSLSGGDKMNAIPRDAKALLAIPGELSSEARAAAAAEADVLAQEFSLLEQSLVVELDVSGQLPPELQALDRASGQRLLSLLDLLPNGALKMSHAVSGLVETSSNVASVQTGESGTSVEVVCSTRSSIGGALEAVRRRIASLCHLLGAECEQPPAYPGWAPDPSSAVLGVVREELTAMGLASSPDDVEVTAIHAGLECGVLKAKCPGMDVVSYGPTIEGAHSPVERVEVATVKPFWDLTCRVLERLADARQ